ncbi:MAG: hypothetical protein RR055_01015, partial [Oscillospiraceae bacterium]
MDLLGSDISIDDIASARIPDDEEYALESILAEYSDDGTAPSAPARAAAEPSLPIRMREEGDGIESAAISSLDAPEYADEDDFEEEPEQKPSDESA